jgi:hypothetical protein
MTRAADQLSNGRSLAQVVHSSCYGDAFFDMPPSFYIAAIHSADWRHSSFVIILAQA